MRSKRLKNTLKVRTRSNKAVVTVSPPLSDKAVGTVRKSKKRKKDKKELNPRSKFRDVQSRPKV